MKIILFRHGEKQSREESIDAESNRSICLSQKGIKQITILGKELEINHPEFIKIPLIFASPFPRTVQSAEIIRNILSIKEVRTALVFKELYAFNNYFIPKDTQKKMHQFALENLDFKNISGYSYGERAQEVLSFLENLFTLGNNQVLVSAHGGLIRALALTIDKKNKRRYLDEKMPEGEYIEITFDGAHFKIIE